MKRILMIEDNKIVTAMIKDIIMKEKKYIVDDVISAEEALIKVDKNEYSLIILDIYLPNMNGDVFLEKLRKTSDLPVIIITSSTSIKNRIKLIRIGANDFIDKKFCKEEIVSSIETILHNRKKESAVIKTINCIGYEIDLFTRIIKLNGEIIELTSREFEILKVLFNNASKTVSKNELYLQVWGDEYKTSVDNTINANINRLRNKIELKGNSPKVIETIYGLGYRLGIQEICNL